MLSPVHMRGVVAAALSGAVVAAGLVTAQAASGAMPERVQPRSSAYPTTTYAVIKTVGVGLNPFMVAVNNDDDTIYVTNGTGDSLSIINGSTGTPTTPLSPMDAPYGVVVDQSDDTVYVATYTTPARLYAINGVNPAIPAGVSTGGDLARGVAMKQGDDTVYVANWDDSNVYVASGLNLGAGVAKSVAPYPRDIAVDQTDDTVYVTSYGNADPGNGTQISVFNGRSSAAALAIPIGPATGPLGVAVNDVDDTVYVANSRANSLTILNGRSLDDSVTENVGTRPSGVAVDQTDDTVYVANYTSGNVSVVNGRTGALTDDTISLTGGPYGIAIDGAGTNRGLIYVSLYGDDSLSTIGRATPSLSAGTGSANDVITLTLTVANLAGTFPMDPATVDTVKFGSQTAAAPTQSGNRTWNVSVPAGTAGSTVDVDVKFKGGLWASAGTFTYNNPTPPIPPVPPTPMTPPGPPRNVTAVAGNGSAVVSWLPPTSSGTYPITSYVVTATAGSTTRVVSPRNGQTCTRGTGGVGGVGSVQPAEAALSCVVTGLTNGTSYTFSAQAQSQAGSSAPSAPSNAVVPNATSTLTFTSPGNYQCTVNGPVSYQVDGAPGGAGTGQQGSAYANKTGNGGSGGAGATIRGTMTFPSQTTIYATVGSTGLVGDISTETAGGGGGYSSLSLQPTASPLVIAGGGGGGNFRNRFLNDDIKGGDADASFDQGAGAGGGNTSTPVSVGQRGGTMSRPGLGGTREDGRNAGGNGGAPGAIGGNASAVGAGGGGGGGGGFGATGGRGNADGAPDDVWTRGPGAHGGGGGGGFEGGGGGGGWAGGGGGAGPGRVGTTGPIYGGGGGGGSSLLITSSTAATSAGITGTTAQADTGSTAPRVSITGNATCRAQISYEGSDNTGGTVPVDSNWYAIGATATVAAGTDLEKDGLSFAGWSTTQFGPVNYAAGQSIGPVTGAITLWAVYAAGKTVTFNANGGSGTMLPQVSAGPTPLKSNTFIAPQPTLNFSGWNTAANGSGTSYTDGATYSFASNLTLYAQWRPNLVTYTTPGYYMCTVVGGPQGGDGAEPVNPPKETVYFTVNGAKGGAGNIGTAFGSTLPPNPGGLGASVSGSFDIAAGTQVYLTIGTNGLDASPIAGGGSTGGGGGGYSSISLGLTSDPIVVAGGGGGGSYFDRGSEAPGGRGGDADPTNTKSGGGNGGNFGDGEPGGTRATPGEGGPTEASAPNGGGGNGGAPGASGSSANASGKGGGGAGGFGASGGTGGAPGVTSATWSPQPGAFGGGGGAGHYGGGGGGGYAGGGGGSSGGLYLFGAGGGGGGGSLLASATTAPGVVNMVDGALAANSSAPSISFANLACSFSIVYMGNGNTEGTVPASPQWVRPRSRPTAATGEGLKKGSDVFLGWSTSQFGSVVYAPGAQISPPTTPLTLWAVYGPAAQKTVTFQANGGSGTMAAQNASAAAALDWNTFTKDGSSFVGWNTAADGSGTSYANGSVYNFASNVTLYAQWIAEPAPATEPIPEPVAPGEITVEIDSRPVPVVEIPFPANNGLAVDDTAWTMTLEGLGNKGVPLQLNAQGVLVLDAERAARTTGTGFLANSEVGLYLDPQVDGQSGGLPTVDLGMVPVGIDGTFNGTKPLPANIKPGVHVLQAVGFGPQGQRRVLSIGLLVVPWIVLDQGTRVAEGRHDRIRTTGSTGGIDPGVRLAPWIRYVGQKDFKKGIANIVVQADGTFRWTRQIKKSKGLTGYVSWQTTYSNQVFWPKVR